MGYIDMDSEKIQTLIFHGNNVLKIKLERHETSKDLNVTKT